MPDPAPKQSPADLSRALIRAHDRAYLGTIARPDAPDAGAPHTSLVLVAVDHDGSPILLVSTLADHTKNLLEIGRAHV